VNSGSGGTLDSGGGSGGRSGSDPGGSAGSLGSGRDAAAGTGGGGAGGTVGTAGAGTGGTTVAGSGGDGGTDGGALCGNGSPDPGEECDTGSESETCDADCTRTVCGDGTLNVAAGEECDAGGATFSCDADCTWVACGDGTAHASAGEGCDTGGETASCDVDCTPLECGDGITNVAAGEACDDGNRQAGDGCSVGCSFERAGGSGSGDTCASAIPLTLGVNQVTYSASTKDYFAWRPTCSQGEPSGPDIVLSYSATFTGTLEVTLAKPDARQWVGVVNHGVCGDLSAPVACISRLPQTSMVEHVPVVAGRTYYFYVSKTGTDVTPLSNPFSVTLRQLPAETGENCGTAIPVTLGDHSVSWTASAQDQLYRTPACTNGAAIQGPDIALSYTAAFDGFVEYEVEKPDATRWVAVATGMSCADDLGCASSHSGTRLRGFFGVSATFNQQSSNRYRHLLIADTSLGSNPLANPLKIRLTGIDEQGGTGETCSTTAKRISLGTNTVRWSGTVNDHLTAIPACTGGHAVRGPDAVFQYDAPASGTLSVTVNKPAGTRWVAVVSDFTCGNVSPPLACLSDYSNTRMKGSLQVTAAHKYFLYVAATQEGTIPLLAPLTITLSQ
jgi:cysteine-rich repeat protein